MSSPRMNAAASARAYLSNWRPGCYPQRPSGLRRIAACSFPVARRALLRTVGERARYPERVLRIIAQHLQADQMVFVGVIDPINPAIETPAQVRDRVLLAAGHLPARQLGAADDWRAFAPFSDVHPRRARSRSPRSGRGWKARNWPRTPYSSRSIRRHTMEVWGRTLSGISMSP